jgi:hypothetical protein
MKPSWTDAPEWARYLAMDENGEWFWFDREPTLNETPVWGALRWDILGGEGHVQAAIVPGWRDTLDSRPT